MTDISQARIEEIRKWHSAWVGFDDQPLWAAAMANVGVLFDALDARDAEVGRLRALVPAAYSEGFSDGEDHDNLSYKYPPQDIAWRYSETREALTGEKQTEQRPKWTLPNSYEVDPNRVRLTDEKAAQ